MTGDPTLAAAQRVGAARVHAPLRPPSALLLALEGRAPWEFAATLAAWPLLRMAPRGDGHPVLVLPGLAAVDATTALLRNYLKGQGYAPHRWRLGVNVGPRDGVIEACVARIAQLRQRYERKVSLVGWSLGGVYARELAKICPDDVRSVISLGSPFARDLNASNVRRVYEVLSGQRIGEHRLHRQLGANPPVPTTSIFSRSDGIAAWQTSVLDEGPQAENIEVRSSHLGLGANPAVYFAIADRLAQPAGQWRPFARGGALRWMYGNVPPMPQPASPPVA